MDYPQGYSRPVIDPAGARGLMPSNCRKRFRFVQHSSLGPMFLPSLLSFRINHLPPLTTTLAPSLPRTPASLGLGLLALPPFLLMNPSRPLGLPPLILPALPSAGIVELLSAKSDQLPVSPNTTCIPPPFEALRVPARARLRAALCGILGCFVSL